MWFRVKLKHIGLTSYYNKIMLIVKVRKIAMFHRIASTTEDS
jgi:hypothetical protein